MYVNGTGVASGSPVRLVLYIKVALLNEKR